MVNLKSTKDQILKAKFTLLFFFLLIGNPTPNHSKNLYSIVDLEALKTSRAYDEYFAHAKDILPGKRSKYWNEMLQTMSMDFVDLKRETKQFDLATYKKIYKLGKWPELQTDEFFQIKRNSYALNYFKFCFSSKDKNDCAAQMKKYWKTAKQDLETGHQMAKLHYGFFPGPQAITYLTHILKQDEDQFYCSKDITQRIFTDYIVKENLQLKDQSTRKIYLDTLISKSCWDKIVPSLKNKLQSSPANKNESIFLALHSNNELDDSQYHEWMVRYFLSSPSTGEILNLSWNSLTKLSEDYPLRMKVLDRLKERDPLPGRLFKLVNNSRSKALAFHLKESFPEYIGIYAKTCLNYLEGRGNFPYGNPTPQCHDLFRKTANAEKKTQSLLSGLWRSRYSALVPKSATTTAL